MRHLRTPYHADPYNFLIALTRTYSSSYLQVKASDEMYFPCCLSVLNRVPPNSDSNTTSDAAPSSSSSRASTSVSSSTSSFVSKRQVTYCVWGQGDKSPKTFYSITAGDFARAREKGSLFFRKLSLKPSLDKDNRSSKGPWSDKERERGEKEIDIKTGIIAEKKELVQSWLSLVLSLTGNESSAVSTDPVLSLDGEFDFNYCMRRFEAFCEERNTVEAGRGREGGERKGEGLEYSERRGEEDRRESSGIEDWGGRRDSYRNEGRIRNRGWERDSTEVDNRERNREDDRMYRKNYNGNRDRNRDRDRDGEGHSSADFDRIVHNRSHHGYEGTNADSIQLDPTHDMYSDNFHSNLHHSSGIAYASTYSTDRRHSESNYGGQNFSRRDRGNGHSDSNHYHDDEREKRRRF